LLLFSPGSGKNFIHRHAPAGNSGFGVAVSAAPPDDGLSCVGGTVTGYGFGDRVHIPNYQGSGSEIIIALGAITATALGL